MSRKLTVTANNVTFSAYPGEILLDAALQQGIRIPHDCRAGQCGTCLIRVKDGHVLGGEASRRDMFHACQAQIFSNAVVEYDRLPEVTKMSGTLVRIDRLAPDIRGLTIKLKTPCRHRPGQYYRFKFRGFPTRCFSPSPPFVGYDDRRTVRLHVKMVRNGAVSSQLDMAIREGHRVAVEGPFGSAFFRRGQGNRLILVASGTGFAPIWAIAKASLQTQPEVPLNLLVGSRRIGSLYMAQALCRLAVYPSADFVATTDEPQSVSEIIRAGSPVQHLPELCATDLVYAAGSPRVVEVVCDAANRAGATFYADPFVASAGPEPSWLVRQLDNLRGADLKLRLTACFSAARKLGKPMADATAQLHDGLGPGQHPPQSLRQPSDRDRFWRNVA